MLAPGSGKTRQARLWVYVRDDRPSGGTQAPAVWFRYSPDRKGIHPQTHLKNFDGILQAERQDKSLPIVLALHEWFMQQLPTLSRKSVTTDAIQYALNQWQALTRYLDDGEIEIDNNAAERALRGVAIGRKNYLFLGSDAGGERAATLYSLLGTAKLNGINPDAYLRHVLSVIADYPVNRMDELLPWRVQL